MRRFIIRSFLFMVVRDDASSAKPLKPLALESGRLWKGLNRLEGIQ
jgi:hypothetical protein